MSVVDRSFGHPLKLEEEAVGPLAGGIVQHGHQCGMLWGTTLAAGAHAYRLCGSGPEAEAKAIAAAGRIVASFCNCATHTDCVDIAGIDFTTSSKRRLLLQVLRYFITGRAIGCFRLAARYAPVAGDEINRAFSGDHPEVPAAPVSCASVLARKMGASDRHAVMAAGLAGGIGLSGGGCGALGAALWIAGMSTLNQGTKLDYKNPRLLRTIERFLHQTGAEFRCATIVGRTFGGISDHAGFLAGGGCSRILEALAAE
ncbi:C-GCAxxG-C-C family protein [Candidatus Fermentibacteria bacterium]|nr:C-GCAxxG-C-C family protein [Candidatus Fermentibacteria bacterium]